MQNVIHLINPRLNRLLLYAQVALPEQQFVAFRKLLLNELGNSGLIKDMQVLLEAGMSAQDRFELGSANFRRKGG